MSDFVIAPPPVVTVPVVGGGEFPVRRIYCVGRNYADHAREMGHNPDREPPFFFSKPRDALTLEREVPYPPATDDLHHEIELVLAIGKGGASLSPDEALDLVYGSAVGVDLTRRDLQSVAKKVGRPWDMAKGFDASAPIGPVTPGPAPDAGDISLKVNGETRQSGDLNQMIWSNAEVISHLSHLVRLQPGDLIFTGTPAGVGPVARGDKVDGSAFTLSAISFTLI
ncbi:fumarylacetoacetate hydrolase family protein [Maricaulaceae bacterium NA33B04]|nr:fumarylacetoacetate hydrolase family protein [Maricaulaceae bacterium NA33B04]